MFTFREHKTGYFWYGVYKTEDDSYCGNIVFSKENTEPIFNTINAREHLFFSELKQMMDEFEAFQRNLEPQLDSTPQAS
jgi:hypothetical protein